MPTMSSSPATTQPQPPSPGRRKREILGPTGLIVMVVTILAFTAVAIAIELASNRGKTFKTAESVLYNISGERVGVGAVSLKAPIQPGATHNEPAIGTAAEPPVNGTVHCRALEPG